MTTTVCPKCGANLDASAKFCANCGQGVSAPAGAAGPPAAGAGPGGTKKFPILPLAIFGGGLVVLVGALVFMRSSAPPGGEALPGAVPTPPPPAAAAALDPAPVAAPPPAEPSAPAVPASSALSFPDPLPPATPVPPAAQPGGAAEGNRAPSTKSWKDPLAGESAPVAKAKPAPPQQAQARPGSPPPPSGRPASPPAGRPDSPPAAPPISRTYDCSESAIFNLTPEDVQITVDGHSIGTADRWDGSGGGKRYVFRGSGIHTVKLSRDGYETVWLRFDVSETSIYRTADVELQVKRIGRKGD